MESDKKQEAMSCRWKFVVKTIRVDSKYWNSVTIGTKGPLHELCKMITPDVDVYDFYKDCGPFEVVDFIWKNFGISLVRYQRAERAKTEYSV